MQASCGNCFPLSAPIEDCTEAWWSPQQTGGLQRTFPTEPDLQVSHETIYRTLFLKARGAPKRALNANLRTGRQERGRRPTPSERLGTIPSAVSIRDRSPTVEDRAIRWHWKDDLAAGLQHHHARGAEHALPRLGEARVVIDRSPGAADPTPPPAPDGGALADADVGSWPCDGSASGLHRGDGHPGVRLRSPKPVATGHQ
jgi:hypothetical protein